ncbi:MAG: hypothetical protein NW206_02490 [Hyphomonadaceae bacterium]|nr:hypothetical protein [Hyphomonadaceae bacterium]
MSEDPDKKKGISEFDAIQVVHDALEGLEQDAQLRVIRYVLEVLKIPLRAGSQQSAPPISERPSGAQRAEPAPPQPNESLNPANADEEGISPVALKWMRRSGIDAKALQSVFSLGIDEIDLVAKSVPGKSIRAKLRSVVLLKAVATYLGTGSPRVTYEQIKEAATHYGAYDQPNFATGMAALSAEVGGSKESGYHLTAKGLVEATEVVKSMLGTK